MKPNASVFRWFSGAPFLCALLMNIGASAAPLSDTQLNTLLAKKRLNQSDIAVLRSELSRIESTYKNAKINDTYIKDNAANIRSDYERLARINKGLSAKGAGSQDASRVYETITDRFKKAKVPALTQIVVQVNADLRKPGKPKKPGTSGTVSGQSAGSIPAGDGDATNTDDLDAQIAALAKELEYSSSAPLSASEDLKKVLEDGGDERYKVLEKRLKEIKEMKLTPPPTASQVVTMTLDEVNRALNGALEKKPDVFLYKLLDDTFKAVGKLYYPDEITKMQLPAFSNKTDMGKKLRAEVFSKLKSASEAPDFIGMLLMANASFEAHPDAKTREQKLNLLQTFEDEYRKSLDSPGTPTTSASSSSTSPSAGAKGDGSLSSEQSDAAELAKALLAGKDQSYTLIKKIFTKLKSSGKSADDANVILYELMQEGAEINESLSFRNDENLYSVWDNSLNRAWGDVYFPDITAQIRSDVFLQDNESGKALRKQVRERLSSVYKGLLEKDMVQNDLIAANIVLNPTMKLKTHSERVNFIRDLFAKDDASSSHVPSAPVPSAPPASELSIPTPPTPPPLLSSSSKPSETTLLPGQQKMKEEGERINKEAQEAKDSQDALEKAKSSPDLLYISASGVNARKALLQALKNYKRVIEGKLSVFFSEEQIKNEELPVILLKLENIKNNYLSDTAVKKALHDVKQADERKRLEESYNLTALYNEVFETKTVPASSLSAGAATGVSSKAMLTLAVGEDHQIGMRRTMEDASIIDMKTSSECYFFGVFDGHGGSEVSTYLADSKTGIAAQFFASKIDPSNTDALTKFFVKYDEHNFKTYIKQGSTAVVFILNKNQGYFVNLGDSEGYLVRGGTVIKQTKPHKPNDEADRIGAAGGFVFNGRVDGVLGVSRAFGDYAWKENGLYVSNVPDVMNLGEIKSGDTILLFCDGVTESLGQADILAAEKMGISAEAAAKAIVKKALDEGSMDNVSAMVIRVK